MSLTEEREEIAIRVKDTGVGFCEAMRPRLFELFSQLHPAIKAVQGGLGIGLAVVKRLVTLHDGRVEAESPGDGQGATFSVFLPRTEAPASAPSSHAPRIETLIEADLRVLVIEDNLDAAESLSGFLRAHGVDTHVAHTGADALQVAQRIRPSVVLLDIGLPDMNGWEVAHELRLQRWASETHIIAISGWAQEIDRKRSAQAGVRLHLAKPIDPQQLLQMIKTLTETPRR